MIPFLSICIALTALAVAWLAVPLLRPRARVGIEHSAANLSILKDQREALARDRHTGVLSEVAYAQALAELEARVIEELPTQVQAHALHTNAKRVALILAVLLPMVASALYLMLGNQDAFDPEVTQAKTPQQLVQLLQSGQAGVVIDNARAQLRRKPDHSELWFVLARAHYERGQFAEAAAAYEKLNALEPHSPTLLIDWADVLAQTQGQRMQGKPEALIDQALAIEPGNGKALAMSGAAAFERGDYARAVTQWEKLRPLVADTELAPQIEQSIARARQAGRLPTPTQPTPITQPTQTAQSGAVSGRVVLSKALADAVNPTDVVFVLARPASGPRMPLAVQRLQVKDLPAKFHLDDKLALTSEHKLSASTEVEVSARISKSGNATAQPGDLESAPQTVKVGNQNIELVIDQRRR